MAGNTSKLPGHLKSALEVDNTKQPIASACESCKGSHAGMHPSSGKGYGHGGHGLALNEAHMKLKSNKNSNNTTP